MIPAKLIAQYVSSIYQIHSCFHLLLFGILEHLLLFSWSPLLIIGNEFLKLSFEFSLWNPVIPCRLLFCSQKEPFCSANEKEPLLVAM